MYGTKLDTIRDNLNKGLTAILDVEPQVKRPSISVEYLFLTHFLLKIQKQFPLLPINPNKGKNLGIWTCIGGGW